MSQEMTSFVLRFVREVSEEQGARWRGLVQHVQSGAEHNFASFADAVRFIQEHVLESRMQVVGGEEAADGVSATTQFVHEMSRMWSDLGPQMVDAWARTAEQMIDQSAALYAHLDQAAANALKRWWLAAGVDQDEFVERLARLNEQVEQLVARVEALESRPVATRKKGSQ